MQAAEETPFERVRQLKATTQEKKATDIQQVLATADKAVISGRWAHLPAWQAGGRQRGSLGGGLATPSGGLWARHGTLITNRRCCCSARHARNQASCACMHVDLHERLAPCIIRVLSSLSSVCLLS